MRRLALGSPPHGAGLEAKVNWLVRAVREIERASHELDAVQIADSFSVDNLTDTRTFDADTGSLADLAAAQTRLDELADVLGTLLQDMKNRGQKRS